MPLDERALASGLASIFDYGTSPRDPEGVASAWMRAYHQFTLAAIAGPTKAVVDPNLIRSGILSAPDFFSGLSSGISAYWLASSWIGGGAGKIAVVPSVGPSLLSAGSSLMSSRSTPQQASQEIGKRLSIYTRGLIVTIVPPTGTPFPAPIT